MSTEPKPKDTQSIWIDIVVFTTVFVFFFYSLQIMTKISRDKPETSKMDAPDNRRPASVAASDGKRDTIKTVNIGCLPMERTHPLETTNAAMIRIVGQLCSRQQPAAVEIKNGSTQEILAFYNARTGTVTTNYFPLQSGANKISFELMLGRKKVTDFIEIVRNSENK